MSTEDADATRARTDAAKKRIAANEFMDSVLYQIRTAADEGSSSTVIRVSASDVEFVPDALEALSELDYPTDWDEDSSRLSVSWPSEEE